MYYLFVTEFVVGSLKKIVKYYVVYSCAILKIFIFSLYFHNAEINNFTQLVEYNFKNFKK